MLPSQRVPVASRAATSSRSPLAWRRRSPLAVLAAALLLAAGTAGCMDGSDDGTTTTTTTTGPAPPAPFTLGNDASGCFEAVGVVLIDMASAQAALSGNWTAADAQLILNTPSPTGMGAVWLNGYTCSNSTMAAGALGAAEFGVLVQPPRLPGNRTASTFNVYQLAHVTNSTRQATTIGTVWPDVRSGNVTVTGEALPGGARQGMVQVTNGTAPFYSFGYVALLPSTFNGTADFWHETVEGLANFHFEIDTVPVLQGSLHSCAFADPLVSNVTGGADCQGRQTAVVVIPQQAWRSEFHWLPGVRAMAPAS